MLGVNDLSDLNGKMVDVKEFDKSMVSSPKKKIKRL